MSIRCVCQVEVHRPRLYMSGIVRESSDRPALLFLLISIVEHAEDPTSVELADHLFGPNRRTFAERLLESARILGLVISESERWSLTSIGLDAIQTETILVPREGAWSIDGILVPGLLWSIEQPRMLEVRAKDAQSRSPAFRSQELGAEHSFVETLVGRLFDSPKGRFLIESEPFPSFEVAPDTERFQTNWNPLSGVIEIAGRIYEVESWSVTDLLDSDYENGGSRYDASTESVLLRASEATDEEIATGRKSIRIPRKLIGNAIEVRGLEIELPCRPVDSDDALNWRLRRLIGLAAGRVQSPDIWQDTVTRSAEGLNEYGLGKVDPLEAALVAKNTDYRAYLNIMAALDWGIL